MTLYSRRKSGVSSVSTNTCDRVKMRLNMHWRWRSESPIFLAPDECPSWYTSKSGFAVFNHWASLTQQQSRGIYKGHLCLSSPPSKCRTLCTGMVGKEVFSPKGNLCSPCQRDVLDMGTGPAGSCHGTGPLHGMAGPGRLIHCPGQSPGRLYTPAPGTTRIALWDLITISEVVRLKDGRWEGVEGAKMRGSCFGRSWEEIA